ncbi:MAG: restriction endonuclease subunit S [Sediminibacterium sp.]|nr:restriction endonuclease subunit S [Sediminibacterium sp.]
MSWEMVKIEDLCTIVRGSSPRPQGDPRYYNGKVPRLMIEDLTRDGKYVTPQVDSLTEEGAKLSRPMKKGDLVMTVSGRTGVPAILNVDCCIHDGFVGFRELSKIVDIDYLFYYLASLTATTSQQAVGAIFKNLTTDQLKNIDIPLPPITTQKRIAEILEAADALKRKDQELIQKYDELAQAIFIDMFGDIMINEHEFGIVKFGDVCDELFLGLTSKVDYVNEGGFPLIRATDINKGQLSFDKVKFISDEQHRKVTAKRITKRGDVLISKSGSLGTCAIVDSDKIFSTYESIFTVRTSSNVLNNIFLVSLVRNPSFQEKLIGGKVGAGVAHLNLNMLREFKFPLPPIGLQEKYAAIAMNIEKQIAATKENNFYSENIFHTLFQKAFKGELTN